MPIHIERAELQRVAPFRDLHRQEANCQIVRDSILPRGLADPYVILIEDIVVGYAGVWNEHFPSRIMEFYVSPAQRSLAGTLFRELLRVTSATHIEAQTNMPLLATMLHDHTTAVAQEKVLFEDGPSTSLTCPGATFRRRRSDDRGLDGEWVVERNGNIVGAGGVLYHYNPPYGDIYMEVAPSERLQGVGSYLVQELCRVCYQSGKKPAARCDPANGASRRTLERGGLVPCGYLIVGGVST